MEIPSAHDRARFVAGFERDARHLLGLRLALEWLDNVSCESTCGSGERYGSVEACTCGRMRAFLAVENVMVDWKVP